MLLSALTVLALGQAPALSAPLLAREPVDLTADEVHDDVKRQVTVAQGHCRLSSSAAEVLADRIEYDAAGGRAVAEGHVLAVSGTMVGVGQRMQVDLTGGELDVQDGYFFQKRNVSPERLRAAQSAEEAQRLGTTALAISGRRIRRLSSQELTVDWVKLTPCDCDPLKPHWYVRARKADVQSDHAWLTWPVIYVYGFPVLALPILYVPLEERKTGLLVPKPNYSSLNGFSLETPVFITLGPSYDLTLTPGFFLGRGPFNAGTFFGVQGPELGTELRYATAAGVNTVDLNLLEDQRPIRAPLAVEDPLIDPAVMDPCSLPAASWNPQGLPGANPCPGGRRPARGLRGSFAWRHAQDFGSGWHDRVNASLLSDGYLWQDVTTDVLQRTNEYIRSTADLFHSSDDAYEGADVTVRQDIRYGYSLLEDDRLWPGPLDRQGVPTPLPLHGPNTLQRLPALAYAVPETPFWGPLAGGWTLGLTRLAPFRGETGDEGVNGFFDPTDPNNTGQGDRRFQTGEREARNRLDFNPTLSMALGNRFVRLRPYGELREDLYEGEVTGSISQRGYGILGLQVQTELSRTFGELRHAVQPSLEVRTVPFATGQPLGLYDELDRAVQSTSWHAPDALWAVANPQGLTQGVVRLTQLLQRKAGLQIQELLRVELGQELDLSARDRLGDTFAAVSSSLFQGALTRTLRYDSAISAMARYDAVDRRVSQASVVAHWGDSRRDSLDLRYDGVLDRGSTRLRQPLDMLVGTPYVNAGALDEAPFSHQLSAGVSATLFGGLLAHYDLLFQSALDAAPGAPPSKLTPFSLSQQTAGIGFAPACDCWRLDVFALVRPSANLLTGQQNPFGVVDYRFNLTISHFGSFGAG